MGIVSEYMRNLIAKQVEDNGPVKSRSKGTPSKNQVAEVSPGKSLLLPRFGIKLLLLP